MVPGEGQTGQRPTQVVQVVGSVEELLAVEAQHGLAGKVTS